MTVHSTSVKIHLIGHGGLLEIFKLLGSESSLTELDIGITTPVYTESQCHNIQPPNTSSLLNLGPVHGSSRLKMLYIYCNNFSGERVFLLAECVFLCKLLEKLYCWTCSLTSSEVINILDYLRSSGSSHKNVIELGLDNNFIDDEGVNALLKSVPELFPRLEDVDLSDNPVSSETDEKLKIILKVIFFSCLQ